MIRDELIEGAVSHGLFSAATLFRFADEVLRNDKEGYSRWVVLRAIERAEEELRNAVDCGYDVNIVDSRVSALRLRLGVCDVRDLLKAGILADNATAEDGSARHTIGRVSEVLEEAAQRCFTLAFAADDAS